MELKERLLMLHVDKLNLKISVHNCVPSDNSHMRAPVRLSCLQWRVLGRVRVSMCVCDRATNVRACVLSPGNSMYMRTRIFSLTSVHAEADACEHADARARVEN